MKDFIGTRLAFAVVASFTAAGTAGASTVLFDFEDVPAASVSSTPDSGLLSGLSMTKSGVTADITRVWPTFSSSTNFDVYDTTQSAAAFPGSWGTRSLSTLHQLSPNFRFIADFSGASINSVSIEYGHQIFASYDVRFQAWDGPGGTGALLSDQTKIYNPNLAGGSIGSFAFAGAGIQSITFWGTGSFGDWLFWDNMNVGFERSAVIPLPTGAGLAGLGLMVIAARRRRVPHNG